MHPSATWSADTPAGSTAQAARVSGEVFREERRACDPGGGGGERVAAVRRRAGAWVRERLGERDVLAGHDPAHREAAAQALAYQQHVREDVLVLDGEHLS